MPKRSKVTKKVTMVTNEASKVAKEATKVLLLLTSSLQKETQFPSAADTAAAKLRSPVTTTIIWTGKILRANGYLLCSFTSPAPIYTKAQILNRYAEIGYTTAEVSTFTNPFECSILCVVVGF